MHLPVSSLALHPTVGNSVASLKAKQFSLNVSEGFNIKLLVVFCSNCSDSLIPGCGKIKLMSEVWGGGGSGERQCLKFVKFGTEDVYIETLPYHVAWFISINSFLNYRANIYIGGYLLAQVALGLVIIPHGINNPHAHRVKPIIEILFLHQNLTAKFSLLESKSICLLLR